MTPAYLRKCRRRFSAAKSNAKRRGIKFMLTFEEWLDVWMASGKLDQCGKRLGQYCMARPGDKGAYRIGNVRIVTVTENHTEMVPYKRGQTWRRNQAKRMRGNSFGSLAIWSPESRQRLSKALIGRVPGFGGKAHSEKTKRLKRRTWKNQFGCGPEHKDRRR